MPRRRATPSARLSTLVGASALIAALWLQPQAGLAKLNAAPGEDGAPSDPQDEADVDALNEALEGPDEGQSWAEWEVEFQAAHEAVFGPSPSTTTTTPVYVPAASSGACPWTTTRSPASIR